MLSKQHIKETKHRAESIRKQYCHDGNTGSFVYEFCGQALALCQHIAEQEALIERMRWRPIEEMHEDHGYCVVIDMRIQEGWQLAMYATSSGIGRNGPRTSRRCRS